MKDFYTMKNYIYTLPREIQNNLKNGETCMFVGWKIQYCNRLVLFKLIPRSN